MLKQFEAANLLLNNGANANLKNEDGNFAKDFLAPNPEFTEKEEISSYDQSQATSSSHISFSTNVTENKFEEEQYRSNCNN